MSAEAGAGGTRRWVGRLLGVAALTFAAGYYLPLYRTHRALVADYGALAERVTTVEKDLARARTDLAGVTAKSNELSARQHGDDVAKREQASLLARAETDLTSALAGAIAKGDASIAKRGDRLVVTLSSAVTESRAHTDVTKAAEAALCTVGGTLSSGTLAVTVVSHVDGGKAGGRDPWTDAGARAATVARALGDRCHYPTNRIATMTRAGADGDGARIDLEIHAAER